MLSWSAHETGRTVDVVAFVDPSVDPVIDGGRALLDFVASSLGAGGDLATARAAVTAALGAVAMTRAAAVVAAFEMFNRVADGIGMPVTGARREESAAAVTALDLDGIAH
jgi:hypothetical protein